MKQLKYKVGDVINIHIDHKAVPGVKNLKRGNYKIINIREPYFGPKTEMVYVFKSTRLNSKYEFCFRQSWVENNSSLISR